MVFNTKELEFVQLDGVVKALRALHYDNADETLSALVRLYSVMAGMPPNGQLPVISGVYVFNLPRITRENISNIPNINKALLAALTAA